MLGRKNAQIPTKSCGSIKFTFTLTMEDVCGMYDEDADESDGSVY